jgi:hypothetical protein
MNNLTLALSPTPTLHPAHIMSYNFSAAKEKVSNNDMLRFACLYLNRRADGTVRTVALYSTLTTNRNRSTGTKPLLSSERSPSTA